MSARPRVTVVIPTRNRCSHLGAALDALERQTFPSDDFEVIVVDDGSTDGTATYVDQRARAGRLVLRMIACDHGGPAAARNAGASAARAPILAFLDDDVVADPQWLSAGLAGFDSDRVAAVEGCVRAIPRRAMGAFARLVENERGGRYLSCNLFVRLDAFHRFGGFDPRFGPLDYFREDTDFAFTLLGNGYEIRFASGAVVTHPPVPSGPLQPLRQARKYRHDRLLWRKHPRLCRQLLDVHRFGPVFLHRPRQRAYVVQVAAVALGLALVLGGQNGAGIAVVVAGSMPSLVVHLVPIARSRRFRAVLAAPVVALVSVAASFVYVATVLREAVLPRTRL